MSAPIGMSPRAWLVLGGVVLAGAGGGWLTRGTRLRPPASAISSDAPAIARSDEPTAPPTPTFLGVILTGEDVDVAPRFEGRVAAVAVHPGDRVRRGQLLAQMDVRAARETLRLANLALADANERLARRTGMAAGVLSQEEISNAQALVLERRGRVAELRVAVVDASVRAPADGTVAARFVEPGAIAGPSRPILRLVGGEDARVRVRFAIPEERAGSVVAGAHLLLTADALPTPLPLVIERVAPEVDSAARMIFAVARVETKRVPPALTAGMVAHVVADARTER